MTGSRMTAFLVMGCMLATVACFNNHKAQRNTIEAGNRFEVATASVVLGARQLLVDSSNGDVWVLEGDRAPGAEWVLLTRGPEDAREPEQPEPPTPLEPEE